ncbi:MAG TPA: efflux transporter outer membrane subunit [Chthoniobacteraceae bacterium]|jgi:NodT family efflux transporter outer membrane factor (OMF) lipoprotein|nr:efflux transporter outer membrane subunit [Chthoniobacteraceae bacterium]
MFKKLAASSCLCGSLLLLGGCLIGPRYHIPFPFPHRQATPAGYKESPANFKTAKGWKVAQPDAAMLIGKWWTVYHDPELNRLEDSLEINNQNIKEYFENFMEARALIAEVNSQLYPTLTADASYTRSFTPEHNSGGSSSAQTAASSAAGGETGGSIVSAASKASPITAIMTSLNLSWEPDLWGRIRNQLRAAQYSAQVSAAELANERLTEEASLAVYYFEMRGQDALIKLYMDTIEADRKALDYTKSQYETGITDQIAVVEATNTLQNAQATATNLGVLRAQYEHAIAVLVGRVASGFGVGAMPLAGEPPAIPVGVPSQLMERRPDVAASERTMAAANADIGMAEAAYFPTVTISSQNGFQSDAFKDLFDVNNHFWSTGGSVSETIFDAGLRTATVHQYVATYNSDLAAYRQAILTAFQQVEDYLAQVRILSQQLILQRDAVKSAQQYLKLEMDRYRTGIDPYVDVVTAQTTLLTDQQTAVDAQVQEMTGSVQLIEALGGGWDRSQLPSAHDVSKWPRRSETQINQ